ncbi:MAG: ATP-binding protein [Defluviitaleaceae bacterium]|nr:ATP-binding protein [Defluviitaleaceae bacterium]
MDSIHLIPTIGIVAFIGNIAIFFLYTEINKSHKNAIKAATYEMEREHYSEQLQLMQQSAEQIKAIRHDMKLHLSTIASYNANNNAQAATDYINKLLGEISKSEVYSETGNITFDSIINFKLNNAKIDNLKPQIHSIIPDAINIEVADIVTILGNLLDNALEAVANEKDKMLKLDVELSKETLFIKVENTFGGELKYAVGKDGDTNHIATQKSGSEHGYGLKNVRRTVEKYNGCMDITHENGVFSVTVMLYV